MGHVDSVQNGASAARLAVALRTMVASVSMTQPRLQFGLALYVIADVINDFFFVQGVLLLEVVVWCCV
jgi:hypothetical protein